MSLPASIFAFAACFTPSFTSHTFTCCCLMQQLQNEVNELKRKEAELRSLLSEVAGSAAESFLARVGSLAPEDLPSRDIYDLVQELGFVQRTKSFAQCLQV